MKIVKVLLEQERCVCNIIPYVKRSQSTVSIQLAKLEKYGVVELRKVGKKIYYKIKNNKVYDILKVLGYPESKIQRKKCNINNIC